MTNNITFVVIILLVMALAMVAESTQHTTNVYSRGRATTEFARMRRDAGDGEVATPPPRACSDSSGEECLNEEEDKEEEEEDEQEGLQTVRPQEEGNTRYISYEALKKDNVPCNRRGSSYYNCGTSGQINPYQRGCTVITNCAREG
ncbi:protein RALF-like 4 [Prunus avium]|uniref:Protein RALF-like 4 n=1 Tax=Prunus avium TaxID=42229 RepID=A0A6P5TJG7_PRUAV|nr:protein RALF-like 4 [Prunus avium]